MQRTKSANVLARLREWIAGEPLEPGSAIPPSRDLAERFDVSHMTVNRAISDLAREGFLVSDGRRGTQIAANPPHLCRYALVFANDSTNLEVPDMARNWSRFDAGLVRVARTLENESGGSIRFEFYLGVDGHAESEDLQRLVHHVRQRSLAGIIFVDPPYWLPRVAELNDPRIPRVSFSAHWTSKGFAQLVGCTPRWFERAFEYLSPRGRSRPALICALSSDRTGQDPHYRKILDTFRQHWPASPDYLIHPVHPEVATAAANTVHALMMLPPELRPDSLLVADDHLVEQAAVGVLKAAAGSRETLDVVGYSNFPIPPEPAIPVKLLGPNQVKLLEACRACLDAQRKGEQVTIDDPWRVYFDDEIGAAWPQSRQHFSTDRSMMRQPTHVL